MPDRDIGVGREDRLRLLGHLVFDDVGLVLDHLAARPGGQPHHLFRHGQIAAVVDADVGDDKRGVVRADLAVGDLHGHLLGLRPWCVRAPACQASG
jgi:hypothetical protein